MEGAILRAMKITKACLVAVMLASLFPGTFVVRAAPAAAAVQSCQFAEDFYECMRQRRAEAERERQRQRERREDQQREDDRERQRQRERQEDQRREDARERNRR
jgi:hypothetical protein